MSMSSLKRLSGVSVAWQKFFNTGLLGAIITTHRCVYCMAACGVGLPIAFCQSVHLHLPPHLSLLGYWSVLGRVLAWINKTVAGYQRDEVYIGTAEERAARTTLTMTNSSHGTWTPA
jgi:hypothetical protein